MRTVNARNVQDLGAGILSTVSSGDYPEFRHQFVETQRYLSIFLHLADSNNSLKNPPVEKERGREEAGFLSARMGVLAVDAE